MPPSPRASACVRLLAELAGIAPATVFGRSRRPAYSIGMLRFNTQQIEQGLRLQAPEDTAMTKDTAKAAALRAKLDVRKPAIAMAAHNPLAAKLAAHAGFDAIWGSGFELSASYAVPDANILSMSTHLDLMRAIGEVQDAPVIADIDTGFGNAVNVAYVVPRYVAAGVAAIVIEDKTFPKDSSLRASGRQELVPVGEFAGKLAAAKAAVGETLVVARTEALIAGLGEAEALRRGAAYAEAGADAVLIHSKQKMPEEILSFCRAWS